MNLAAIILAAGASRRMGRPKALLPLGGETFIGRMTRVYGEVCDPVVLVLGAGAGAIQAHLGAVASTRVLVNERWPLGQLTSLQCALGVLDPAIGACLFTPVDCPRVRPDTIRALARELGEGSPPPLVVMPRYKGRRGHPVGCARELFAALLGLAPERSARDVVHAHRERTVLVDVEDAGILEDVDTPGDYRKMEKSFLS